MTRYCFMLGFLASCSFAIDAPAPARPRLQKPTCETEKNLVVVDSILATTAGVATVGFAADSSAVAIVPALFGALFIASAIHGNRAVEACRAENEIYRAELATKPAPLVTVAPVVVAPPAPPPPQAMARDRWADFWKVIQ